jgi:hypothetical protein
VLCTRPSDRTELVKGGLRKPISYLENENEELWQFNHHLSWQCFERGASERPYSRPQAVHLDPHSARLRLNHIELPMEQIWYVFRVLKIYPFDTQCSLGIAISTLQLRFRFHGRFSPGIIFLNSPVDALAPMSLGCMFLNAGT